MHIICEVLNLVRLKVVFTLFQAPPFSSGFDKGLEVLPSNLLLLVIRGLAVHPM